MAFNLSKVEFLAKTVEVDKIDDDGNIVALLCDKSFFQVYDNREQMTEFYNGEGLYWSYMWHKWGTYAVSPFAGSLLAAGIRCYSSLGNNSNSIDNYQKDINNSNYINNSIKPNNASRRYI